MKKLHDPGFKRRLLQANKLVWMITALAIFTLVLAACSGAAPADESVAEPAAEVEATEPPAEEAAAEAEPTEPPAEEAAEAEATEPPAEEEAAEAEATAPAEEEAAEAEATAPAEEEAAAGDALPGEYIFTLTGGCGCHMNRDPGGLAGGTEFETPAGMVYASNITPDAETGIGNWTADQIATALQTGSTPDGQLHPVMPYMRFSALSNQEALAIGEYLLAQPAVSNAVTETVLSEEPAAYTPAVEPPAEPSADPIARGEQLVVLTACGGCHTPKNEDGSNMEGMLLAGAPLREEFAANLTPDAETGIGAWSEESIANFLRTGTHEDGTQVEGAMAQQIERRFSTLTEGDAAAIAAYLKSIPAVVNVAPAE